MKVFKGYIIYNVKLGLGVKCDSFLLIVKGDSCINVAPGLKTKLAFQICVRFYFSLLQVRDSLHSGRLQNFIHISSIFKRFLITESNIGF